MSAFSPRSGIQVSSVYPTYTHMKGQCPLCVCVKALFLVSIISNTKINIYFVCVKALFLVSIISNTEINIYF